MLFLHTILTVVFVWFQNYTVVIGVYVIHQVFIRWQQEYWTLYGRK